jgi:hypothetical protein
VLARGGSDAGDHSSPLDAGLSFDAAASDSGAQNGDAAPASTPAFAQRAPWPEITIHCGGDGGVEDAGSSEGPSVEWDGRCSSETELAEIPFPEYGADEYGVSPLSGLTIGKHHVIGFFRPDATQCEIVRTLAELGGRVVGWSVIGLCVIEFPCADFEELDRVYDLLHMNPLVSSLSYDLVLSI